MSTASVLKIPKIGRFEAIKTTSKSLWYDAFKRLKRNRAAVYSGYFIVILCVVALFAEILAPYTFDEQNMDAILHSPSAKHWFGTDDLGRDLFSRLVYGAQ